jgi:glycosyltransferase involved in cell wall biosynthesis
MEDRLRTMAGEMGLDGKVKFLGWRDDIHEMMHAFDIFVLPSRNEGMGRVIVEAMAAGKPVVASNVGGIPDLVRDGVNGYLVPSEDSVALAGAMARLLKDPDRGKAMGSAGREMAKAYTVEKMVDKIDRIYQEALAGYYNKIQRSAIGCGQWEQIR